jgi:hypothetical protein
LAAAGGKKKAEVKVKAVQAALSGVYVIKGQDRH